MDVTATFVTHLTSLVTGAFTSLWALILSPLWGLVIFGLAISYLFYAKQMAKVNHAKG
jgi:hypothetical protein